MSKSLAWTGGLYTGQQCRPKHDPYSYGFVARFAVRVQNAAAPVPALVYSDNEDEDEDDYGGCG